MSEVISQILKGIKIPKMVKVRQHIPSPCIDRTEIGFEIRGQLSKPAFAEKIKPGMSIAITAGSRGIANIPLITKTIVDFVKEQGAYPFIVPSMGSHGGATAEGQTAILYKYGLTEEYLGCPIRSSMAVKEIGMTGEGHKVYIDKIAAEADGIIVACRIKAHTNFVGPFESGIMKMMVIGLGNDFGTTLCHDLGIESFRHIIPLFGKVILKNAPVLFAVATLDNAYHETYKIKAVLPEDVEREEPLLLKEAKSVMPRLFFDDYDVLIVDRIGKDISGCGMDPYVTGAFDTPFMQEQSGMKRPQKIAVLDLSDASNGNAYGTGNADAITKRLWQKAILEKGYPNAIVANCLSTAKIPVIMENDLQAIKVCLKCCTNIDRDNPRVIRIQDTLHIEHILISEAMLAEAKAHPRVQIESEPFELVFDDRGNLR